MKNNYLFSSESVTEGHPDKMCDIIADAILDEYVKQDRNSRVACEVTATTGMITVMGEITSAAVVDIAGLVRKTVNKIGYNDDKLGFNAKTCAVMISLDRQSEDIRCGISPFTEEDCVYGNRSSRYEDCNKTDEKDMLGAGDQGMMFGYACNETDNYMPAPIFYAHSLCKRLSYVRKCKTIDYLGPDGKAMVTFEYIDDNPVRIASIVISTQHKHKIMQHKIKEDIIANVINTVIPKELIDYNTEILINPSGRFVKGGPAADTGLTGRKIIVDTYGGKGRHGGGSFSGKDPTKVDRTGAYAARYIAKNIVAARIADKCEVQISYAIGIVKPVSVNVDTFGTSQFSNEKITQMIKDLFDLRPASLIKQFDLQKPIYEQLAAYGHMGREDIGVAWEKTDKAGSIRKYFNL